MRFQVPDQSRNFRNHSLHRRLERGGRRREVLFSAQEAGNVHERDLSHASTVGVLGGVIATPDAHPAVTGLSEGGNSVSNGGRDE